MDEPSVGIQHLTSVRWVHGACTSSSGLGGERSLQLLIDADHRYTSFGCHRWLMNWFRNGLAPWKPVRALVFGDQKVFFWIKGKLGLSEYQMAALVWLNGLIIGVLVGAWLF